MEKSPRPENAQYVTIGKPPEAMPMSRALVREFAFFKDAFNPSDDRTENITKIYHLLDRIYAERSDLIVCRKGCAYCCKLKVDAIPIEAEYISRRTGKKIKETRKKITHKNIDYCPFLDTETAMCTIYEYRPFACRAFATYDSPEFCKLGVAHYITGGPMEGWGSPPVKMLYLMLFAANVGTNKLSINDVKKYTKKIKDIREWF